MSGLIPGMMAFFYFKNFFYHFMNVTKINYWSKWLFQYKGPTPNVGEWRKNV